MMKNIGKESPNTTPNVIPQYKPIFDRPALAEQINKYILSDGFFTEFKHTEEFERRIADFLQVKHCTIVSNGTISLSLALLAYGIKPGDKVLIPNITMIATCNAVKLIGAQPVIWDVDIDNGCLDLKAAGNMVKNHPDIKAVIYVTLNGRSHIWEELHQFEWMCMEKNVFVIYDNAQSFGSSHPTGIPINCMGSIGSFSFSMPKIITTGQGGCLITNDSVIDKEIRKLKDFGRSGGGNDIHNSFGINAKFTEMQAIMGINQIETIYQRVEIKKWIYERYYTLLKGNGMYKITQSVPWFVDHYCMQRDGLAAYLEDHSIKTRNMYPEISTQKCNWKVFPISLENSKFMAENGLWLPSSLDITEEQIVRVCDVIKEFYNK